MQKFIVTSQGHLRFGNVNMHRDLLLPGEECIGGGVYEFNYTNNTMLLSGKSYDYGRVKWSYIDTIYIPRTLDGMTLIYEDLPLTDFVNIQRE